MFNIIEITSGLDYLVHLPLSQQSKRRIADMSVSRDKHIDSKLYDN